MWTDKKERINYPTFVLPVSAASWLCLSEDIATCDKHFHEKVRLAGVMCHLFPPKDFAANSVCGAAQKWEGPCNIVPFSHHHHHQDELPFHRALYFSIRQLSKWSGPLEVYKQPCLIKGDPPSPAGHTPAVSLWTFVKMLGGRLGFSVTLGGRAREAPLAECFCFQRGRWHASWPPRKDRQSVGGLSLCVDVCHLRGAPPHCPCLNSF